MDQVPYKSFSCDVTTAILVNRGQIILNIDLFVMNTNMAADILVVLIPRNWVKSFYCISVLNLAALGGVYRVYKKNQ